MKTQNAQAVVDNLAASIAGATDLLKSLQTATGVKASKGAQVQTQPKSTSSAGRNPSDAQQNVRDLLMSEITAGNVTLFTIKGLTESVKQDRIQVRNAVQYLEAQNIVERYAEILPQGRGQRELLYKAKAFIPAF